MLLWLLLVLLVVVGGDCDDIGVRVGGSVVVVGWCRVLFVLMCFGLCIGMFVVVVVWLFGC